MKAMAPLRKAIPCARFFHGIEPLHNTFARTLGRHANGLTESRSRPASSLLDYGSRHGRLWFLIPLPRL
jgi:hypothetical protein